MKIEQSYGAVVFKGNKILIEHMVQGHISIPKGHVEGDETPSQTAIREIKEETGLTLKSVHFCGIKEWKWESDSRYLGFLYKSDDFEGEIQSSKEGEVFWIKKEEIKKYNLSQDFEELFDIIDKN